MRPVTFPQEYAYGTFRRDGNMAILALNVDIEISHDNVVDVMPAGLRCKEFVDTALIKDRNGIKYQVVRVVIEGWAEYVPLSDL